MMSSEEEVDCFGSYGDKLSKKSKRSRQRVDAGEPRNSYSSIPNFSSRPSFLTAAGGLYGALFNRTHVGPLPRGFGPSDMLNELLGRQVKQAADAGHTALETMMAIDQSGSDGGMDFDCINTSQIIQRGLEGENSPPPGDVVAHHVLRDILQGRKDLIALERELRSASVGGNNESDNNNSINNNNNNNNDELKNTALINGSDLSRNDNSSEVIPLVNGVSDFDDGNRIDDNVKDDTMSDDGDKRQSGVDKVNIENGIQGSDSEQSVASPSSDTGVKDIDESGKDNLQTPDKLELKRARVENIVSSMRSSPSLPTQVNGCKKRKLYHPQQHDTTAERYSGVTTTPVSMYADDDTVDNSSIDPNEIRQKKVEKDALKSQLRNMQEQLAEMQQKYVQLCTRMDQDSECPDGEDASSDIEPENSLSLSDKANKTPPSNLSTKETPSTSSQVSTPTHATPIMSKTISAKFPHPHTNGPQIPLPPNFNGALSLLHHQVLQEQHGGPLHHPPHHHSHTQLPHHALSSAAAMYHKLFMEQEARLNKEAAIAAEQQLQHQHHLTQQQHLPHLLNSQQVPPTSNSQTPIHNRHSPTQQITREFPERVRTGSLQSVSGNDLEGLADVLKTEITSSLGNLIDTIMSRFVQQKRIISKPLEIPIDHQSKDIVTAAQLLDRRSPRTKVIDRGPPGAERSNGVPTPTLPTRLNGTIFPNVPGPPIHQSNNNPLSNHSSLENNINSNNIQPIRPSPNSSMFQTPKPLATSTTSPSAVSLFPTINLDRPPMGHSNPFCTDNREGAPEQNEALSLVVPQKKKRHKVTDTRITPRTVSRILAQDGNGVPLQNGVELSGKVPFGLTASDSPPHRQYHPPPPPMLPVSLPTSVAIPNPSLHESKVFSPYSPFYHQTSGGHTSPELQDSPPLPHPPSMLHPVLLAAAQQVASPDYSRVKLERANDPADKSSDGNSGEGGPYDGLGPTSSTLTPMHLRKAKLMFFWVRYPSSAVLKTYFPDIYFNKNNTAQLVKWFSNFREFYYIQMEKYARQAVSEGVKSADDLHVSGDCEIYRVLNLHYNRNNHIEVPMNFRYVVEQTLREFFKAIQTGKDSEQSWKKSIYKIISRLDDPVPEYFKTPNFLEQLE